MSLLKKWRVWLLFFALIASLVAIAPQPWTTGATIRFVEPGSAAQEAGFMAPEARGMPVLRERITAINGQAVLSEADFLDQTSNLPANVTLSIQTNRRTLSVTTREELNITVLDEEETVVQTFEFYNETTGSFENRTERVTRNKTISTPIGVEPIGLSVYDSPKSNIRLGLDLSGGARVLVKPVETLSSDNMTLVLDTIRQRLNVYGLADVTARQVSDLAGEQYILVEVAGATEQDIQELILTQGKFEAKVANVTVMRGGIDIPYVCRSPDCSGLTPGGCRPSEAGYSCQFSFSISVTGEAAQKQADETAKLSVVGTGAERYLSEPLELYLDDRLVDSLLIGASLQGVPSTQISISGSGSGITQRDAAEDSLRQMKQLQTVLITGSLPTRLEVVKTDTISAELGDEFISNAFLVALVSLVAIMSILMIRYRSWKIAIPVITTLIGEVVLILGVAAIVGWNIDLAAIAGIIVAIGTGVDDQIVMADEGLGKKNRSQKNWKDRLGKAFFVIFTAYFTTLAAMIPLFFAGAGLVKGFALTTIIGVTIGVLITRPVFALILEELERKKE